jgi:hypothetical protein
MSEASRCECDVGFQQSLEFQERLVVEHMIDLSRLAAASKQRRWRFRNDNRVFAVKRSSCVAATMRPSSTSAAALS